MNRKIIVSLSLLILSFVFAECASTTKSSSDKDEAAKEFTASEDKGSVYLYRTNRAVGAAGQTLIKINGQDAGGTGPGTYFKWDLKPGTYTFSCSTSESSAVVEIDVKGGQIYYIRQDQRLGISDGRVTLKETDAKKGQGEIKGCKLIVSTYHPQ